MLTANKWSGFNKIQFQPAFVEKLLRKAPQTAEQNRAGLPAKGIVIGSAIGLNPLYEHSVARLQL
jgi:hypothetical protein